MIAAIEDVALATLRADGSSVLLVNPGAMMYARPTLREFVYWHACSHIVVGELTVDLGYQGISNPLEGWVSLRAVQMMVQHGFPSDVLTTLVAEAYRAWADADGILWDHPPPTGDWFHDSQIRVIRESHLFPLQASLAALVSLPLWLWYVEPQGVCLNIPRTRARKG